jgi:hypothetical protein
MVMGLCVSFEDKFYTAQRDGKKIRALAKKMNIDFEFILQFFECFVAIDEDNSGFAFVLFLFPSESYELRHH